MRAILVLLSLTASALALAPASARADDTSVLADGASPGDGAPSRLTGSAEAFPAQPLAEASRDRFGVGFGGAAFAELNLTDALGLHAGVIAIAFRGRDDDESTSWVAGATGLRLHWGHLVGIDASSDGWVDSHLEFGRSGGIDRLGFDVGLGYEFPLNDWLRMGPFARFAWASDPMNDDPTWVMAGLGFGFGNRGGGGERLAAAALVGDGFENGDGDGDGVTDAADHCPDQAAGRAADPDRPGCPMLDADRDGVADALDACPDDPRGPRADPTRPGCPPRDSDGDGVVDLDDLCPDEGVGDSADPRRAGCPDGDTDGDGFANSIDDCPEDEETPNGFEDDDGCPDATPIQFVNERLVLDERVLFDYQKARVRSRARPVIAAIAAALRQHPEWTKIRIEGHTDSRGPRGINRALSERRARNVVRKLVDAGVDPDRLEYVGFGSKRPLDRGGDDEAFRRNRRVEFVVVERVAD